MNTSPPHILKPVEPGIVCLDIERMLAYYTQVLGLHVVGDAPTAPELSARFGASPEGYRIIRLESPEGFRVKLLQPVIPAEPRTPTDWVQQRAGLAYLTFVVSDLDGVVAWLQEHGVRMVGKSIVEIRAGIRAIYTRDPEDNYLEFIEYV